MTDSLGRDEVPTVFANIVTSNLNVDQMTMELRWFERPHRHLVKEGSGLTQLPPAGLEDIMAVDPVARVVLTFSAVKALKQYLDTAFPEIEKQRSQS